MKLIIGLIFLSFSALAMDMSDYEALNKAYCEKGVEKACEAKKCLEDKTACKKKADKDHGTKAEMELLKTSCGGDEKCIKDKILFEIKLQYDNAAAFCKAGNQSYCYEQALMDGVQSNLGPQPVDTETPVTD